MIYDRLIHQNVHGLWYHFMYVIGFNKYPPFIQPCYFGGPHEHQARCVAPEERQAAASMEGNHVWMGLKIHLPSSTNDKSWKDHERSSLDIVTHHLPVGSNHLNNGNDGRGQKTSRRRQIHHDPGPRGWACHGQGSTNGDPNGWVFPSNCPFIDGLPIKNGDCLFLPMVFGATPSGFKQGLCHLPDFEF